MWYLYFIFSSGDGVAMNVSEYYTREAAREAELDIRNRGLGGSVRTIITFKGDPND